MNDGISHAEVSELRDIVRLLEDADRSKRVQEMAGLPRRIVLREIYLHLKDEGCTFLLARANGKPLGCAAIRTAKSGNMYIKFWAFNTGLPNPDKISSIELIKHYLGECIAAGCNEVLFLGELRNKSYLPILEKLCKKMGYAAEICTPTQSWREKRLYGVCTDAIKVTLA